MVFLKSFDLYSLVLVLQAIPSETAALYQRPTEKLF